MSKVLTVPERLIVAADFKPGGRSVLTQILTLCDQLADTGVIIKVNSALRMYGYSLIDEIHSRGLLVFADLKLYDIGETLATDAALLAEYKPSLVTVCCDTGLEAMMRLREGLPDTEVLGVTILTTLKDGDMERVGRHTVEQAVHMNADLARCAKLGGLICSALEVPFLNRRFGNMFTYNCPGIRFADETVIGDDQNQKRVTTPAIAIQAGATRVVMGRPVTKASDPRAAVQRALEEISGALA